MQAAATVAFVTTDPEFLYGGDPDESPIRHALEARGVATRMTRWRDPEGDWRAFDLVVLRSPWDYALHADELRHWLSAVEAVTEVLNCPDLVRWNMDKHYLADLAAAGVPCVDTAYARTVAEVESALAGVPAAEVVLKPTVSAGARDTGRFARDDPGALALATHIVGAKRTVMVQPAVASVAEVGELALLFFDGRLSHAVRKGAILAEGGGLVGGSYRERLSAEEPSEQAVAVGQAVVDAVEELVRRRGWRCRRPTPLYARVDLVDDAGTWRVLEAELMEPSYFLDHAPGA